MLYWPSPRTLCWRVCGCTPSVSWWAPPRWCWPPQPPPRDRPAIFVGGRGRDSGHPEPHHARARRRIGSAAGDVPPRRQTARAFVRMEKLHHPLWIVHAINVIFGPIAAAILRALGREVPAHGDV